MRQTLSRECMHSLFMPGLLQDCSEIVGPARAFLAAPNFTARTAGAHSMNEGLQGQPMYAKVLRSARSNARVSQ